MQSSHNEPPRHDRLIALALGLLLLGIYLSTSGFRLQSIDEVSTFTPIRSLLNRGTIDADTVYWQQPEGNKGGSVVTGSDGHAYEVKDIGLTLVSLPLVWIAYLVKVVSPVRTALLVSPIITAATAALIFLFARARGFNVAVSILAALTFGLATLAWPYAETLFTQPLAALGLLAALAGTLFAAERRSWRYALLGGVGVGIASISAIPTLATLPVYPLALIPWASLRDGSWRSKLRETFWLLVAFGCGLVPFGVLHAVLNQARFGNPLTTPYHASQVNDALQLPYLGVAGFGLLLSTPRGLLWYVPAVILIPFGVWLGWKTRRREVVLAGAQAVATILMYSTYVEWWGGNAWGPRFLAPIMPALVWLIAPLLDRLSKPSPWWARALAALPLLGSAVLQALATVFNVIITERRFFDALISVRLSPTLLRDYPVLTDPAWLPWQRLATVISRGHWDTLWMSRSSPDWLLIGVYALLIGLGIAWLAAALRRGDSRLVRLGLAGHAVATIAVIALALTRYPRLPNDYTPVDTPPMTDLDTAIERIEAQAAPDDEIVTLLPYSYLVWLDRSTGAIHDTGFGYEQPVRGLTERRLEQIAGETGRVWLVSEKMDAGNASNGVEQWLSERAFTGAQEVYGDIRLVPYTFPGGTIQLFPQGQEFGKTGIRLDSAGFELVETTGAEWINVRLRWETSKAVPASYTVFVHLLDESGQVASQHDGIPQAGYAPTTTWAPGEQIEDRHSIPVDLTLPAGMYRISVGLYDTFTGERLPLAGGSGDTVIVGNVDIR